jgi:hypothetical protein
MGLISYIAIIFEHYANFEIPVYIIYTLAQGTRDFGQLHGVRRKVKHAPFARDEGYQNDIDTSNKALHNATFLAVPAPEAK